MRYNTAMTEEQAHKVFLESFFRIRRVLRGWMEARDRGNETRRRIERQITKYGKREALRLTKVKRECEANLKKAREKIKEGSEYLANIATYYDQINDGKQPNFNELSEMLGISETALHSIIKKHNVPAEEIGLIRLAFVYKAEDTLEPQHRQCGEYRYPVIWEAMLEAMLKRKEEDPQLKYLFDKGAHEFFPELFPEPIPPQPPKPKRHLHVVH